MTGYLDNTFRMLAIQQKNPVVFNEFCNDTLYF